MADLYPTRENITSSPGLMPSADVSIPTLSSSPSEERPPYMYPTPSPTSPPSRMPTTVTMKELYEGRKFPFYDPSKTENDFAYGQPWITKMMNAIGKGIVLTGTTFINSTLGLLYGAGKWIYDGKFSSFYNNELTRGLDGINKELEERILPNYYTDVERDARWYSPKKLLTANFIFDGIIKNLGFAAGAALAGGVYAAGIKAFSSLPGISRLVSIGKMEEAMIASKGMRAVSNKFLSSYNVLNPGGRAVVAGLSTLGEAGMESLQNLNQFRDKLVEDYKSSHYGEEPVGDALKEINDLAESVGNASFRLNTALLFTTNSIQFPKILGSSYAAEKGIANDVIRRIGKVVEKDGKYVAVEGRKGVLGAIGKVRPYLFSTSESFEEGAQYAIQTGTQDYYNKRVNGETPNIIESIMEGIRQTVGTDEGMENVLIGGLSGALMLARGKYREAKAKRINTAIAVDKLNKFRLSNFTNDTFDSINRGVALQEERERAIKEGRVTDSKDLETDYIINYLSPRIKYGRYDLVTSELETYRQLASTEEGFSQLQEEGKALATDTQEAFLKRIDVLAEMASDVKSLYQSMNLRFGGILTKEGKPKYSSVVLDKMVYASSKVADYDRRISSLTPKLIGVGILTDELKEDVAAGNTEKYDTAVAKIKGMNVANEDELLRTLDDVSAMTLRRKKFLDEYKEMKESPEKYDSFVGRDEGVEEEEEEEKEEEKVPSVETEKGEQYKLDREYETKSIKLPEIVKMGDVYQVKEPDGKISTFNTEEEAKTYKTERDAVFSKLKKVKIIGIQDDGNVKVEDSEGNTHIISPAFLSGYTLIATAEEERLKKEEATKKYLSSLEMESGSPIVITEDLSEHKTIEENVPEGRKKDVSLLFTATKTESEDWGEGALPPHIKRSFVFLNNAKGFANRERLRIILVTPSNETSLGLGGLSLLSYGTTSLPSEATDIDNGLIMAVFIEQDKDKLYYVDENGERINGEDDKPIEVGNSVDINKVIFQTMPSTTLTFSNNTPVYRSYQKEEAIKASNLWRDKRKEIINNNKISKLYRFSISRGIPTINPAIDGKYERNNVGNLLVPEKLISKVRGLVEVCTTGAISFQGRNIKFRKGISVLNYEDVLAILNNSLFTREKAKIVYRVLKEIAEQIEVVGTADINMIRYIQGVLLWKKAADGLSGNQVYIDAIKKELYLAGNRYHITDIAAKEEEIVNILMSKNKEGNERLFHNVNNYVLKERFDDKFIEYVIKADDSLGKVEWINYQTYLLASRNPDGSSRGDNVPLTTIIAKPTAERPYVFKQKYASLFDFDANIQTNNTKEYKFDWTNNIYEGDAIPKGITFRARIVEGEVTVEVDANDVARKHLDARIEEYRLKGADYVKIITDHLSNINKRAKEEPLTGKEDPLAIYCKLLSYKLAEELKKTIPNPSGNRSYINNGGKRAPTENNTRKVGDEEKKQRITEDDIKIYREWAQKHIPSFSVEILDRLIDTFDGEKAWGVFEDNVIKFYRHAIRGTEYHEAFEAIWNTFLSPEEREAIINDERNRGNTFVDRQTGKTMSYSSATDQLIKERIADDFADYRLGKISAKSLGQRIVDFFRKIIEFFKTFGRNPSLKTSLFDEIEKGRFKEAVPLQMIPSPHYRRIEGLTQTQVFEFVRDMHVRTLLIMFGENNKEFLYNLNKLDRSNIFDRIKSAYISEGKYNEDDMTALGESQWTQLVEATKESLMPLGIIFKQNDDADINDEDRNNRDYAPETFDTDWKSTSPQPIKIVGSSLPKTKGGWEEYSSELPQKEISPITLGYVPINFSQFFATLLGTLSNTSDVNKAGDKLIELAKNNPDYVRLFVYLGGKLNNGKFDFSSFKYEDWRFFINFFQTFTKQRPASVVQTITADGAYTRSADIYGVVNMVKREWFERIKTLSKDENSPIVYSTSSKTFKVKKEKLPSAIPNTSDKSISFLQSIGITFTKEAYDKLDAVKRARQKRSDRESFLSSVVSIYNELSKGDIEIATIRGDTLGISGSLNNIAELFIKVTFPNQENTHLNAENKRIQNYAENNQSSIFENEFNEGETDEELKARRPELNDVYARNSIVLKRGGLFYNNDGDRIKDFKVGNIEGIRNVTSNKGTTMVNLSFGDRTMLEINQNLNGNYYILLPAESSTEWMNNLGNYITFDDIKANDWGKIYDVFIGYLYDEIDLASDYKNREKLLNAKDKAKQLRFFKDILSRVDDNNNIVPSAILNNIHALIEKDTPSDKIKAYVNDNLREINKMVRDYIEDSTASTVKTLVDTSKLITKADGYIMKDLDVNFASKNNLNKNRLSIEDVNNIIRFTNVNYIINNTEFHKILFGDPYLYSLTSTKLDATKRFKLFLSPRRTTFDINEFNTWLNTEYNKVGDVDLEEGDIGYHNHKPYMNTITFDEVTLDTPLYKGVDEADAMSWITDVSYREAKLKNGQWTPEAEEWHQWQLAYTRNDLSKRGMYEYKNEALRKEDEKKIDTPEPAYLVEIIKPIVSGAVYGEYFNNIVIDKFAQMPLYYKAIKGTNLEKLYLKMIKDDIGYAIMNSGRRAGATELTKIYKDVNKFNDEFVGIVRVPWRAYGIQLETHHDNPRRQTRGSQPTKISSMDMFDKGKAVSEEAKKQYERNTVALNLFHKHKYEMLLKKLGIDESGENLVTPSLVADTLKNEMLRRGMTSNGRDTLRLDENNEFAIPFEASNLYTKIRDIFYSMVVKSLISPKMSGGQRVQVAVTLWENSKKGRGLVLKSVDENNKISYRKITGEEYKKLSDEDKKNVILSSDTLKFYSKESPYCEVMLPCWFRNKFDKRKFPTDESIFSYLNNTEEGREILTGVGFRIPTQSMASMELFRVAGFLPAFMGETIVVPSEIVAKAGSDFDIDKVNTYLKSVYVDENGDVKLIRWKGSEEATKDFYRNIYLSSIGQKIERLRKAGKWEMLYSIFNKMETLPENTFVNVDDIISLSQEQLSYYKENDTLIDYIISKSDDEDILPSEYVKQKLEKKEEKIQRMSDEKLMEEYVDSMYEKALENEYYDSLEKMMSIPENFERMTSSIGDAGLKKLSDHIDGLRGISEGAIRGRLLNRTYMTRLRHSFLIAKKWIGIVAVNITGHSMFQKANVYIDPTRFSRVNSYDRSFLQDGKINLPHNTIGKEGYASLSGVKTADGKEYISDRLSGYATAVVDAPKDPYIIKLIQHDRLVGIAMFLERLGIGKNTVLFLNQPIIQEYIKYIDKNEIKTLFNRDAIKNIKYKFQGKLQTSFSLGELENNIRDYHSKGLVSWQNGEQIVIFDEFLKYAKMAEYSFRTNQALSYDTTKFRSGISIRRKKARTRIALEDNIFRGIDEVINNTFLKDLIDNIDKSMKALGSIMKFERSDFSDMLDGVMSPYFNEYIKQEDFDKIANKMKSSFLDYIIHVKRELGLYSTLLTKKSSSSIDILLEEARRRHPDMKILNDLTVESSELEGGAVTVKLRANIKEPYDEDLYVDMMREVKAEEPRLYKALLNVAFIQGSYQSAVSIHNIIPLEDYSKNLRDIMTKLSPSEVSGFTDGWFEKNNWRDDDIVPTVDVAFVPLDEEAYETADDNDINEFKSKMFYSPGLENLGWSTKDRRLLFLNQNSSSVRYISYEFVKVPRVYMRKDGEMVDTLTGQTITKREYALRRQKGDKSLSTILLYRKVKFTDGSPLVTKGGNYVYKLTNAMGDGQYAVEYYDTHRPSIYNNGTMKIEREMINEEIIKAFSDKIDDSPSTEKDEFNSLTEFSPERKEEILTNFMSKHNMDRQRALNYINEALLKDRDNVIELLKKCY